MLTRRQMLAASVVPVCTRLLPGQEPTTDPLRVYKGDKKSSDPRLGKPKALNDYFPFSPPKTLKEWESRRKQVREQVQVATGLWPMPEKTPLQPTIHGQIERDGYVVRKVFFPSLPGHYVCGNLYEPTGKTDGKRPGVLCPHGHWRNGRFFEATDAAVEKELKSGAEKTKEAARYPVQARCAMLARMGCVVFHYDMVGYADSTAIKHIARSGVPHPDGFADAQGELRLQSLMGLQTWNSIRSLDFLESLPNVDPKKLGVTGSSGGGTQTFLLTALDDRVAAAFPAVMVSTAMQGGCVCENCSLLRVGTGNIELAALFAPKPMAMSGADDWTKEILTKGFPDLQATWKLYGAEDKVAAKAWPQFPHNYNLHARELMYAWFDKHLLGGKGEPISEKPFEPIPPKELSVFDEKHPRPKDEVEAAELRKTMSFAADAQMAKLFPSDPEQLQKFRDVVGTALRAMVVEGGTIETELDKQGMDEFEKFDLASVIVRRKNTKEEIPAIAIRPPEAQKGNFAIWLHPAGKASLVEKGRLSPAVASLIRAGHWVAAPDLLRTGEHGTGKMDVSTIYAGFTYGYNRSLLADRVRDVLTVIASLRESAQAKKISLVGWGEFGPVAVLAAALAGDRVSKVAADLHRFRFEEIAKTDDPMMLPGAVKYGGLGAFLALCAPMPVLVHNNKGTGVGRTAKAAYKSAGVPDAITVAGDKLEEAKVIEWLVK